MDNINTSNYRYMRKAYYTNYYGLDKTDLIIRVTLSKENFNFDLANVNGSDLRIAQKANGSGLLKIWIAHWDYVNKNAVIFCRLPFIKKDSTITFYVFWGFENAIEISDPDSMDFLFYEDFRTSPLSGSKWTGATSSTINNFGFLIPSSSSGFTTTTSPLNGLYEWTIEAGLYVDSNGDSSQWTAAFLFLGPENPFNVAFLSNSAVSHTATSPGGGTWHTTNYSYNGTETGSYQTVTISYHEFLDSVLQRLSHRNTYPDTDNRFPRKVEGNTKVDNIRIRRQTGTCYINWFTVREYEDFYYDYVDTSELYIPHENVGHQSIDFRTFSDDKTSVLYFHHSSIGGNPYSLSVEEYDDISNVWLSEDGAVDSDHKHIIIGFDRSGDITSKKFRHFNSSQIGFYTASKLSGGENNKSEYDHWQSPTTSGWAAIDFGKGEITTISSFIIKAVDSDLDSMAKDYVFYGSNYDPRLKRHRDKWVLLTSGNFEKISIWQYRSFKSRAPHRYYILDVLNTYGSDIKIQSWGMFQPLSQINKNVVTQLRIHPIMFDDLTYCFPKYIRFQGSHDMVVWDDLIPLQKTYTPFVQHYVDYGYWQRYSFYNTIDYANYRLSFSGNWGDESGRIGIGSWSMHALYREDATERILCGTGNNIKQIWADDDCGINDNNSFIYLTNDKLNTVVNNYLAGCSDVSIYHSDIVKGG